MEYADIEKLRKKLIDYYGTGAMAGMPAMFEEVSDIKKMSDDEVVRKAKEVKIIQV